jgi:hypothetical protein
MSQLLSLLETQINDLCQNVGATFCAKSINIPHASQKAVCFWFSILWRQISRRENVTDSLAVAARQANAYAVRLAATLQPNVQFFQKTLVIRMLVKNLTVFGV